MLSMLGTLTDEEKQLLFKLLATKFAPAQASAKPEASPAPKSEPSLSAPPCKVENIIEKGLPVQLAAHQFDAGVLNGIKLCDFITDFWTEEKSPYYEQQRAHRKDINGTHCQNMRAMVTRYWKPFFGDATVDSLNTEILNQFFIYLATHKKLKSSTINKAINSAAVAFAFYFKQKKLTLNPMDGIERFGKDTTERGILTREEVEKLFSFQWPNKKKQLANMLAAYTGMRAGEISALRYCDIYDDRIYIQHNWSVVDGEKEPKRHEIRWVVCPPSICEALRAQARKNPNFSDNSFVFFSRQKNGLEPVWPEAWLRGLDEALELIGISTAARKSRHIDFHSWRHFYATEISEKVRIETAQKMLGHKDVTTTSIYASHQSEEHMQAVQKVMEELSRNIIVMPNDLVA